MPALPPLGLDIDRCITKTLQNSKMAKMLYVINVMLHENASVKKIKNEQVIFLCLIKLDSFPGKISGGIPPFPPGIPGGNGGMYTLHPGS